MSKTTSRQDIRTLGYVLRRTNYGEADRIINIITPHGKISAIAKGVRREKSKLAGGIEMFSRLDLNIHTGKSDLGIVTSAKMLKYFGNIIKDFNLTEFAGLALKKVNTLAEHTDNSEYYHIVDQVMMALDSGIDLEIVKIWTFFNLVRASGEEINLYHDVSGQKLSPDQRYDWDFYEKSLAKNSQGEISADEIKVMRLILSNSLKTVAKVKSIGEHISPILKIAENL